MSAAHEESDQTDEVGYRRPPKATRFQKGRSGNPRGRPRNRHRQIPHDTVLGQMVTIREDGRERRVTAAEAFLLQLTRKGLQGDSAAARASLSAIETARLAGRGAADGADILRVIIITFGVGTVLRDLGLGVKNHPLDKERVRWDLKPWIVEMALARLGSKRLDADEQREVWRNTYTPGRVAWPDWWSERG